MESGMWRKRFYRGFHLVGDIRARLPRLFLAYALLSALFVPVTVASEADKAITRQSPQTAASPEVRTGDLYALVVEYPRTVTPNST